MQYVVLLCIFIHAGQGYYYSLIPMQILPPFCHVLYAQLPTSENVKAHAVVYAAKFTTYVLTDAQSSLPRLIIMDNTAVAILCHDSVLICMARLTVNS